MAAKVVATFKDGESLKANLTNFDRRARNAMIGQGIYAKGEMVKYAKKNAPWRDDTGHARAGLHADHNVGSNFVEIIMAHSVPYGIWLEVRFSGKYAIINPTLMWGGRLILKRIESTLLRLGAGK